MMSGNLRDRRTLFGWELYKTEFSRLKQFGWGFSGW